MHNSSSPSRPRSVFAAGVLSAAAVLSACGGGSDSPPPTAPSTPPPTTSTPTTPPVDPATTPLELATLSPKAACESLVGKDLTSAMKVASGTVKVDSATLVAAAAAFQSGSASNPTYEPAVPEFCKVVGTAGPVDTSAPLINFQVNLPTAWNQRAMQLGGSGLNGSIPASLNNHRNAPESQPVDVGGPLTKGYIELGSDGGHQGGNTWLVNEEAITNYAYGSDKKTHDAAVELARLYYGQAPRLMYFAGSSQGGRESLSMVQLFPEDYDGVFTQVPVLNLLSLTLRGTVLAQKQTTVDTYLPSTKVSIIANEVLRQCDALDGIADGVVSAYDRCNSIFLNQPASSNPWVKIRCASGTDEGATCLSDGQIATLKTIHTDISYGYPIGNGNPGYAAPGVGGESGSWLLERAMPTATYAGGIFSQFWKGLIAGDLNFAQMTWDPAQWKDKFVSRSSAVDALNPDLSKFLARGGKLILKVNTGDYTANWNETVSYYKRVVTTMGQENVDKFLRFYVAPGQGHSMSNNPAQRSLTGEVIPSQFDSVNLLDAWVAGKQVPSDTVMLYQKDALPPFAVTSSRPMCRYPQFPKFMGGDKTNGANYTCSLN